MSEVKNKKKKSSIIQVSIGVLAVILAILIIIMMGIVSDIQGTARIVNYTGLVRGETQRIIKLEVAGEQDDAEAIHQLQRHLVHILADGYRRVIDSAVEGGVVGFLQISGEIFRNRSEHVLRNIPAGGQAVDVVGIEGISVAAQGAGHEISRFGKSAFDLFICHDFPSSREVCPDFGGISLLF